MPPRRIPQPTPNTLTLILAHVSKFLTVAIHHILAQRNCYPSASFVSARAYNLPVRQNRHPGVCEWINAAVAAVRAQLALGAVHSVVLAIHHPNSYALLERFVFDLSRLPPVPRGELDTPIVRAAASPDTDTSITPDPRAPGGAREHELADLLEQFRAALTAISACGPRLREIPKACTFTLAVELKDAAAPPIGHPQPWIPVEPEQQRTVGKPFEFGQGGTDGGNGDETEFDDDDDDGEGLYDDPPALSERGRARAEKGKDKGKGKERGRTVPLRSIDAGEVVLEMWVEEGVAKKELTAADFEDTPAASFERLG